MSPEAALSVGDTFTTVALTVTEAHLVNWSSLTGDWYYLHVDAERAAASQFGGRLAHGPLVVSLALGLSTHTPIGALPITAWLGMQDVRAVAPTMINDTIHAIIRVAEVRPTQNREQSVVSLAFRVLNQRGVVAMTFTNVLMVARPNLVEHVETLLHQEGDATAHFS